jgi:hypothetical protein
VELLPVVSKLPFILSYIPAIRTDVAIVLPEIAAILPHIAAVFSKILPVLPQIAPVLFLIPVWGASLSRHCAHTPEQRQGQRVGHYSLICHYDCSSA